MVDGGGGTFQGDKDFNVEYYLCLVLKKDQCVFMHFAALLLNLNY